MDSIEDIINSTSCSELKFRIDMVPSTKPVLKAFPVLARKERKAKRALWDLRVCSFETLTLAEFT